MCSEQEGEEKRRTSLNYKSPHPTDSLSASVICPSSPARKRVISAGVKSVQRSANNTAACTETRSLSPTSSRVTWYTRPSLCKVNPWPLVDQRAWRRGTGGAGEDPPAPPRGKTSSPPREGRRPAPPPHTAPHL